MLGAPWWVALIVWWIQHAGRYGLTGHEEAVLVLSVVAHIGRLLIERATHDFLALAERLRSPT